MNEAVRDELIAQANRLSTQGLLHHKARRLEEAEAFHRQALAVMEQALGPDDPGIAEKLNDLAWVLSRRGKHEEADVFLNRSLAFLDGAHPPAQRKVLRTMESLAEDATRQGRVIDAERMYRKTLRVREQVFGSNHPSIVRLQDKAANVRRDAEEAAMPKISFRNFDEFRNWVLSSKAQKQL